MPFSYQLSCNRDNLPMFELVDSQPSHMVSVDAINLTPGEKTDSCFPFNYLYNSMIFLYFSYFLPCSYNS